MRTIFQDKSQFQMLFLVRIFLGRASELVSRRAFGGPVRGEACCGQPGQCFQNVSRRVQNQRALFDGVCDGGRNRMAPRRHARPHIQGQRLLRDPRGLGAGHPQGRMLLRNSQSSTPGRKAILSRNEFHYQLVAWVGLIYSAPHKGRVPLSV